MLSCQIPDVAAAPFSTFMYSYPAIYTRETDDCVVADKTGTVGDGAFIFWINCVSVPVTDPDSKLLEILTWI